MKKWLVLIAVLMVVLIAGGVVARLKLSGALSGIPSVVVVGDAMPDFSLQDCKGNTHRLKQYGGKIVVLEFCSHKCPFSRGIDQDLAALVRFYADNDNVIFLGIDSHYDTTDQEIREYINIADLPQPILRDPGNQYADAVGALVTPDFFLIDKEGKLAYRGAFDNRILPERPGDKAYVAYAIEALLTDIPVNPTHVPAWGCTIKRAP